MSYSVLRIMNVCGLDLVISYGLNEPQKVSKDYDNLIQKHSIMGLYNKIRNL